MPKEYIVNGNDENAPSGVPLRNFRPYYGEARTLTADDNGAICEWNTAAGYLYTLPPCERGLSFKFVVRTTITSSAAKVICTTGDFFVGSIMQGTDTTYLPAPWDGNGTTHLAISMNGSTTGGFKGDWIEIIGISQTLWLAHGLVGGSGTEATMFSTS